MTTPSALSTAKLRGELINLVAGDMKDRAMTVTVMSFGFKYGLPMDADLVFDVRFLPNPHYIAELRYKTGLDQEVRDFVFSYQQTKDFVAKVDAVIAQPVVERMQWHKVQGHKVVVVSASVDEWVRPWCEAHGVDDVIATRMVGEQGRYTGRFDGPNCNGREKVNRIAAPYSPEEYHIVAYGNSSGDYPMFRYAHEAYLCTQGTIAPFEE